MKKIWKHSRTFIILGLVGCLMTGLLAFGVTSAWMFRSARLGNTFIVGEDKAVLYQDFQPPQSLQPGDRFTMGPWVKNEGNLPDFVRMCAEFSTLEAKDACDPLAIDTANWELKADGFYYYKHLLMPGDSTTKLFQEISVKASAAAIADFDFLLYAESVQHMDHAGAHPANEWETAWD